jgi:hypothetical protein
MLGGLALGEMGAWLTLRGLFFMLATLGVLALGAASLAASASGGESGREGRRGGSTQRRGGEPVRRQAPRSRPKPGGSDRK